uniref:Uncharacterized protein n=1 Tax=Arundo donax TaxID=35708 RepID=A0A0A8Z2A4_ARUDO
MIRKKIFKFFLTNNDPVESSRHKNYLCMERWTKASSSAEPQNDKSCSRLVDANKGSSRKHSGTLPFEFMESTVAETLMVGVSRASASVQHARQFSSNMRAVVHDVCRELGPKNNEHCDESFERCMQQKAENLHARAVVSETYSLRKLSEFPLDFQKLGSSDNPSSDWSHFPMLEINRKNDNILNPKRRSALGHASMNVNMSTTHVMTLSSQEYMMHSHQIVDENMDTCKPAGGIVSHLEDPTGLSSDPSGQKLKGHLSDTMSCSCSKDNNNSSDCQIDEQHEQLLCAPSGKKFKLAGNNKNQIALSACHNQKSRKSSVQKQQDAANRSNNSKWDGENFHGTYKSCGKVVSSSLLPYEQQHLKTQRTKSAANLNDSYMPPAVANASTVNSKPLAHGKELTEKSAGSCKRKGPCLFETLTIPSKSQSAYHKNLVSSGKSSDFGLCMYGTNIGSCLFGGQSQSPAKTETLYSDTLIVSNSPVGEEQYLV